jgi:hypothetical protein
MSCNKARIKIKVNNCNDLLFIHIPKTGGMSIKSILDRQQLSRLSTRPWTNRHMSVEDYIFALGREEFDSLFKFTVIRNPYARLLSYYYFILMDEYHREHIAHSLTFHEFVEWSIEEISTQFSQVSLNGKLLVDLVLRYENLLKDWKVLAEACNIPQILPYVNITKKYPVWEDLYTQKTLSLVREVYSEDFREFGYG